METRREYIEKLAQRLRIWDTKVDELRIKAEGATNEMKIRYRQEMMELKEMRDRVSVHLVEVREASDTAWRGLKKNFKRAVKDVKESFKKAA